MEHKPIKANFNQIVQAAKDVLSHVWEQQFDDYMELVQVGAIKPGENNHIFEQIYIMDWVLHGKGRDIRRFVADILRIQNNIELAEQIEAELTGEKF